MEPPASRRPWRAARAAWAGYAPLTPACGAHASKPNQPPARTNQQWSVSLGRASGRDVAASIPPERRQLLVRPASAPPSVAAPTGDGWVWWPGVPGRGGAGGPRVRANARTLGFCIGGTIVLAALGGIAWFTVNAFIDENTPPPPAPVEPDDAIQ